jgi:hypothetical protein
MRAWKTKYISRLEYFRHPPFVRVVHTEKEALDREAYPVVSTCFTGIDGADIEHSTEADPTGAQVGDVAQSGMGRG